VLFGLGHVGTYGFSSALLIPASVGLVITLLYMFRNNLVLCMLVHCAIDALMVIAVPALLSK
jgi:membrane protease YdiL (CAAX protease family)